jgi:hypothetical protein
MKHILRTRFCFGHVYVLLLIPAGSIFCQDELDLLPPPSPSGVPFISPVTSCSVSDMLPWVQNGDHVCRVPSVFVDLPALNRTRSGFGQVH